MCLYVCVRVCVCVCVLPQCCHGVAQLVYHSAEQQCGEEVGQLAGGQVDPGDLKTPKTQRHRRHEAGVIPSHVSPL